MKAELVPVERIERAILQIRGHKVILDRDLAVLYEVETFNLNKAVKRNLERFPVDFMFQLTENEFQTLIFQFGMSKKGRGGRRHRPFVFTEQGVAMLSSVLRSKRAVLVNVEIMRAFVRMRRLLATHENLSQKLMELEKKFEEHDKRFAVVFQAIRELMEPSPERSKGRIGFKVPKPLPIKKGRTLDPQSGK